MLVEPLDRVEYEVDLLFSQRRHVRKYRGRHSARRQEEVGEAMDHGSEIVDGAVDPRIFHRSSIEPCDVDGQDRPRDGVEAGGIDDEVQRYCLGGRRDPFGNDPLDGCLWQRNEMDVRLIKGLQVHVALTRPLATVGMIPRHQVIRGPQHLPPAHASVGG